VRTGARLALAVVAAVHLSVLLAGFLAPYDYASQDRDRPYVPPSRPRFVAADGRFTPRPFVRESGVELPLRFFVTGSEYRLFGLVPCRRHLFGVDAPGRVFLLGTDAYGRDVFSRLLFGGQVALLGAWLAVALALGLAAVLGAVAGFYGGPIDELVMRSAEVVLALPWLYLLLGVRAALPLHLSPAATFVSLVAVLACLGWARPARLVRGIVLSARQRDYVRAARGFGASDLYLLRRHLLPEAAGVLLTQAALLFPHYVLAEVNLSFLGLGTPEPVPSWGSMLASLLRYHVLSSCWWMFSPVALLVPLFMALDTLARHFHRRIAAPSSPPAAAQVER
jgi:peptide/nickel transport system permease protein